ncbi:MAG: hypothetical protein EWV58_09605 [Microcystis aeruginosa Ma_MB_F_20061100_S19]|nr:MAG: hypothetical protein EWV58_09605 [Microcystis aeruginosa Ma_MB_F_20061100_S19]TRU17575.1 MAG: hypothetical protein EWV59_00030 [Microcystis aeruginosa Ma_MB_F_20061100_S19D]
MRNVNLNILKFVESINNFCLSLSNIGLGDSYQLSVIRCEFLVYCLLKKLPTPHTLHPSPFSLLPNPHFPSKLLYRDGLGKHG